MRRALMLRVLMYGAAVLLTSAVAFTAWLLTPIDPELLTRPASLGVTLTDREGIPLRDTRAPDGARWRWISLSEMDPVVAAAFMAAEDRRFLDHDGIAWTSVLRAMRDNLAAGRVVSGASTITMQTARLLRGHSRGVVGKMQQVAWALRLERHVGKDRILEQYLNRVPLGQGTIGVEAASRLYFGVSASRLGPGPAALLAGIARSPARDNPFSAPERAAGRRGTVLRALETGGYISEAQRALADAEPAFTGARSKPGYFRAPHFTTRVLAAHDTFGTVRTSIDWSLQHALESDARQVVQSLAEQRVQQAAVVVLDNASGEVLAWIGSPDFDGERGQVDMVVSRRQPGSALKPFLYARAFEMGYGPSSILDDIPRTWMTSTGPYRPRNYDRQFRGPVRARVALGSSLNLPAVQLTDAIGASTLLDVLHRAGFASLTRGADHYGLGLALGNGEVTLLELTNAYRALANQGEFSPVSLLLGGNGADKTRSVVRPDVAALTLDILADADARLTGFGDAAVFAFPFPVAVKTGTSRHFTDNWAVAVTGAFTVGVWVGNFDGTPMAAVSGIAGAGPLLRRAVLATAARRTPGVLPSLTQLGATTARVCGVSGLAATPECSAVNEWQLAGASPLAVDDWHRDGAVVLPERFAAWQAAQVQRTLASATAPPRASHTTGASLTLLSPKHGDVYLLPSGPERSVATLALRAIGGDQSAPLSWSVNNKPVVSGRWALAPGTHVVRVSASDGEQVEARIVVRDQGN